MAKKISNKDIFEDGLFSPAVKNAQELNEELDKLELGLKGIAATVKKDLKNIKIVNFSDVQKGTKAIKDADAAYKGLSAVEKERIKLNQQLKKANSTKIQQNEELRLQIQKQNKYNKDVAKQKLIDLGVLKDEKKIKSDLIAQKKRESDAIKKIAKDEKDLIRTKKELLAQRKRERKQAADLKSAYKQESKTLNDLRKRLKDLSVAGRTGGKVFKGLQAEVTRLDTKLKNADAAAGQFQRNVGNYPKGLSKAAGALKNFAGALGVTAGVAGLVRAIGGAVNIFKDFEQGNANLAAVLGKTKSDITALSDDAKRLGATTAFTATQVSGLQVEFAKLGFNEQEILNATEATLSLAAATGSDLGEAAAIAGATLGGFGLGADETQRVVDVMAKSFSTSALDIEKFKESMKNAAPAAKAVGISVEQTTALLGTLANAGISGSKAGNNLKTSFINLNKAGLTLEQGLEKVANSEDKLGTAAELVGKNAAASFLVLSEGVDVTKELTTGLENAGGAAKKMADEQLDTLSGSLTILGSAWEGFILSLEDGQGALAKTARGFIDVVSEILSLLSGAAKAKDKLNETELALRETAEAVINVGKVIGVLITSFIAYKTAVIVTNIATKAYTFVTTALRIAKIALSRGTNIATLAMRAFNTATKANPIGLLISLVTAAAAAFFFFKEDVEDATEAQKGLNDELERTKTLFEEVDPEQIAGSILVGAKLTKFTIKELGIALTEFQKQQNELSIEKIALIAIAGETAAEFEARRKLAFESEVEDLQEIIDAINKEIEQKEKKIKTIKKETKAKKEARLTDAEIQKARQQRLDLDFDRDKQRDDENQKRLDAAAERQRLRNQLALTHERGLAAEKERNRLAEEKAEIAAAKAAAKRREEQFETAKEYLELTSEAFAEGVDKEEKEQDEAIKRREESVSLQQSRAEQGLENTLAFEKEQLAKAELERARTAEKRAKQEEALALAQAFLNAFAARAKDDPDTAAARALTDVILAKALSETVAGAFAEGVEDFKGEGTGTSDSNLIRFSHGESVVTAKGTKENQGLVTAMNNGDVGSWFAGNMMLTPLSSEKNYDSFGILAQKIDSIEKAIRSRPTTQTNLDNMGNVLQSTYRNGIKNTVKYVNKPGII